MISGRNILLLSTADWDNPLWTNKQHIASRLAEKNRVLYVESLGMRAPRLSLRDAERVWKRLRRGRASLSVPAPKNLKILSPKVIPFWRNAGVRRLNIRNLLVWLNRHLTEAGFNDYVLWSYTPFAALLLDGLKPKPERVVYHCVDNLSALPGVPEEITRETEQELCRRADVVFFTSDQMRRERESSCRRAVYVGNVAETPGAPEAARENEGLRDLPRPRVGFLGAIDSAKLDWPILQRLAEKDFPGSLVLVGPLAANEDPVRLQALLRSAKARWLKGRRQAEALSLLRHCDVLIIPYAINEYTRYVFPMKLFEYLGLGKPVVSTPLPEVRPYHDSVAIAATPEQFERAVLHEARTDSQDKRAARETLAASRTWNTLLEMMARHLNGVPTHAA